MNPQASMVAMNAAAGGPVGGNAMDKTNPSDMAKTLNTYIYDYLLKNNHKDVARAFSQLPINYKNGSPHGRGVNGVDQDTKDEDNLPLPAVAMDGSADNSFLLDWFSQFWDMYAAASQRGTKTANLYFNQTRAAQERNGTMQQKMGMPAGMATAQQQQFMNQMRAQAQGPGVLARRQMNAVNGMPNAQMQQMQANQMMKNNPMQRDGSGMNMGDQRAQSPGNGENAPSPSKRPRLDGSNGFNGPMGPAGRGQPMQGAQMGTMSAPGGNQMMLANGMTPEAMQQAQFGGFQGQNPNGPKPMEGMNPNGPQQGSPMVNQMDGSGDLFAGNAGGPGRMAPAGPNAPQQGQAGNHALQDYQMQLMLLEQQNKKRLLMARQEQDNMPPQPPHGGPGGVGQPGFGAPAMSPSGSRTGGPSPNPADQMKRATPKLPQSGLPGSPMPDGTMQGNRGSPLPNGTFDPSQMPAGMPPQYYQNGPMGPNGMRPPPSSHPGFNNGQTMTPAQLAEMQRRGGQMPNGMWQGQPPMMGQSPGQQPPQMGTPQQQNRTMPPPPAPPASEQQRTQPPSPQPNANAPPTPNQTNKANPKDNKKSKVNDKKKNPAAKGKGTTAAAGATPVSDADPPPTPTPATPSTPMHQQSFANQGGQKNGVQQVPQNQQPGAQQSAAANAPAQMDLNVGAPFGMDNTEGTDLMAFTNLDGPDVLENFDFDSFLHTGDDANGFGAFDTNFDFNGVDTGEMTG